MDDKGDIDLSGDVKPNMECDIKSKVEDDQWDVSYELTNIMIGNELYNSEDIKLDLPELHINECIVSAQTPYIQNVGAEVKGICLPETEGTKHGMNGEVLQQWSLSTQKSEDLEDLKPDLTDLQSNECGVTIQTTDMQYVRTEVEGICLPEIEETKPGMNEEVLKQWSSLKQKSEALQFTKPDLSDLNIVESVVSKPISCTQYIRIEIHRLPSSYIEKMKSGRTLEEVMQHWNFSRPNVKAVTELVKESGITGIFIEKKTGKTHKDDNSDNNFLESTQEGSRNPWLRTGSLPIQNIGIHNTIFEDNFIINNCNFPYSQKVAFKCDSCGKELKKKSLLKNHMLVHTFKKTFQCEICEKYFHTRLQLTSHLVIHTEKKYKCHLCRKMFHKKNALKNHMDIHNDETFPCHICQKVYKQRVYLRKHLSIHTHKKTNCHICWKQNVSNDHINNHYQDNIFRCGICEKEFQKMASLKTHIVVHTEEKPFKCDTCGIGFKAKGNLYSHMHVHSPEKKYKCIICEKQFRQMRDLKDHSQIHKPEKDHKCGICSKEYRTKSKLNKHVRSHSEKYQCDICGKYFKFKYNLKTHLLTHSNVKPFKCNICGHSSLLKFHLTAHLHTHSKEKSFKCHLCGKYLKTKAILRNHLQRHYDDMKPFKCNICGKAFRDKGSLTMHLRIHSDEKPFKCHICGKCFKWRGPLTTHLRIHS